MKPNALLFLLPFAAIMSACARDVDSFSLLLEGAGAAENGSPGISLTEDRRISSEDEGLLIEGLDSTPNYLLRTPRSVGATGETWYFRFTNLDRQVSIVLFDSATERVAGRAFEPPPGFPTEVELGVEVPAQFTVGSFRIEGRASGDELNPGPRLVGIAAGDSVSGPFRGGVGERRGNFALGADTVVTDWAALDGDVSVWALSLDRPSRTASPLLVTYSYETTRTSEGNPAGEPSQFSPPVVVLEVGNRTFEVAVRPGTNSVVIYPDLSTGLPGTVRLTSQVPGFQLRGVSRERSTSAVASLEVLPADLGVILDYPASEWRDPDYEVFSWTLYPDVLIMDTLDYDVQARFFKRLAFFVEKEGFRGQLLRDDQLAGRHGYNAHNYNSEGLAQFFNEVQRTGLELNGEERELREILIANGVIRRRGDTFAAGRGGILSLSQESGRTPGLRHLLLTHEAFHGVYYADVGYRDRIDVLWAGLTNDEQRFWGLLLDGLQYDVLDPYLVRNEFHAYLLQQDLSLVPWYFETRSADRLRRWKPAEIDWINSFLRLNAGVFLGQASEANRILFEESGLIGGDVYCVREVSL